MIIHVGSQNKLKVGTVTEAVALYPDVFPDPEVVGKEAGNAEFGHPKSLDEIVEGAINRAKAVYEGAEYSFGLESGMFAVPHTKSGFQEIQACCIYDGTDTHLGFSPAFEWPKEAAELILSGQADGSASLKQIGLTDHEKIGAQGGGAINLLTHGRLRREDQLRSSIIMAMVQVENKEWY